ncbi:MAG: hypothetical protein ACJ719_13475 [Nitrososphaeraceae archaeon]
MAVNKSIEEEVPTNASIAESTRIAIVRTIDSECRVSFVNWAILSFIGVGATVRKIKILAITVTSA